MGKSPEIPDHTRLTSYYYSMTATSTPTHLTKPEYLMAKIDAPRFTYFMLQDEHVAAQRTFYNEYKHLLRNDLIFKLDQSLLNAQQLNLILSMKRFVIQLEPCHKK